jgi:hypothetical protein
MTLELSRIWFQEQLGRLADGARRLTELNSLRWRFPGKRGPERRPAPAPAGIRRLASEIRASPEDVALIDRAIAGEALRAWELRRVEYLAVKFEDPQQ